MCSWNKAVRLLCAAGLALALVAPGTAALGAVEATQPGPEWYLPLGHWAYMYCDYFAERGDIAEVDKSLFDGNEPVLLGEFIRAVAKLGEEQVRFENNFLSFSYHKRNTSNRVSSYELPLASVTCDLIYELHGALNQTRNSGLAGKVQNKLIEPWLADLARIWQELGNADKPLAKAVMGDSHPEAWCFAPAVVGDPKWAGLEVLGLIHWTENEMAKVPPTFGSMSALPGPPPPDWASAALREVLGATLRGREVLGRLPGELTAESAIAQLNLAVAALRNEPELDAHILLTTWGLAATLYGRESAQGNSAPHPNTELTNLGGLALKVIQPFTAGLPESVYEDAYNDVSITHWMYAACYYITRAGWLGGYPEEFFSGGRVLTTYEFAQAMARMSDAMGPYSPVHAGDQLYLVLLTGQLLAINSAEVQEIHAKWARIEGHVH